MASGTIKAVASKADINALSDQIATEVKSSSDTVANTETWLATLCSSMENNQVKNIKFQISTASGAFLNTTYIGKIIRYSNNYYGVDVLGNYRPTCFVQGTYVNGTWYWNNINDQIKDTVDNNYNLGTFSTLDDLKTALNTFATTIRSGTGTSRGRRSIMFTVNSVSPFMGKEYAGEITVYSGAWFGGIVYSYGVTSNYQCIVFKRNDNATTLGEWFIKSVSFTS